jgi:hypothetical protein
MTDATFSDLVTTFFQRKNNANCRFPHKLFNALAMVQLVGVQWVSEKVFHVDKLIFGMACIEGGLFQGQGTFPSHGLADRPSAEITRLGVEGLADFDEDRVKVLDHKRNLFARTSREGPSRGANGSQRRRRGSD